jgi:hypothetical protein
MGSSVSNTVTDEELDRHVAELILKDAKKKAERYGQHGVRAFLASSGMYVFKRSLEVVHGLTYISGRTLTYQGLTSDSCRLSFEVQMITTSLFYDPKP